MNINQKSPTLRLIISLLLTLTILATGCEGLTPANEQSESTQSEVSTVTSEALVIPTIENSPTAPPTEVPPVELALPLMVEVKYDLFAPQIYGPEKENFPSDVNTLTGLPVQDPTMLDLGAVMVSITNFPASARPQAGLSDAPHVYEMFIGEGQTRFLAVFYGEQPQQEPMVKGNFTVREELFKRSGLIAGNQVFLDENGNGIHDYGEWGMGGVGVSLLDGESGRILETTTTDTNGYYGFNVFPGRSYFIQVIPPGGFKFSPQLAGFDNQTNSKADVVSGISPLFTSFYDNLDIDVGLVPINPWRHIPEGGVLRQVEERDYAIEAENVIEKLRTGKVDVTSLSEYTYSNEILTTLAIDGFKDPGDAVVPGLHGFPQPLGWNVALMQNLVDAWTQAVDDQADAVNAKVNVLVERLKAGDMNAVAEARMMMLLLGGKVPDDPYGDNGPFRVLPDGANSDQMQKLIDAAREGAGKYATILAESLRIGDLHAFDEVARLMLFLREKYFLKEEDLGGILGVNPQGPNAQFMQALVYAVREGSAVRADQLIERINQDDPNAVREAEMLMQMLAEKRTLDLDAEGLPVVEGPNAAVMQLLGDAIRLARVKTTALQITSAQKQAVLPISLGAGVLMCPAPLRSQTIELNQIEGGEVEVAPMPADAMIFISPEGFPAIFFSGSIPSEWMTWAAGESRIRVVHNVDSVGSEIIFPPFTTFKQKADGTIIIVFPPLTTQQLQGDETDTDNALTQGTGTISSPCLSSVSLPANTVVRFNSQTNQTEVIPPDSVVAMNGQNVSIQMNGGGNSVNFVVPNGTSVANNVIYFPSSTQVLLDNSGILFVTDPSCSGTISYNPEYFRLDWNLIGPTRSGRIYMTQFAGFFSGGCLVYAHKDPSVPVSGCQVVVENYQFANINGAGLDPSKLREIGEMNKRPGWESMNYSANIYAAPGSIYWGSSVLGNKDLSAYQEIAPGVGVLSSLAKDSTGQVNYVDQILMFYSNLNQSLWKYDPLTRAYLRYEDLADSSKVGVFVPSLDRFTGRQLYFANVLVLFAPHDVVRANVINVELEGRAGTGLLFKYGTVQKIFWNTYQREYEKETQRGRPIKIVDADGNPYPLASGQSWYHLVVLNADAWEIDPEINMYKIRNYEPE